MTSQTDDRKHRIRSRLLGNIPIWKGPSGNPISSRSIALHNDRMYRETVYNLIRTLRKYNSHISIRRAYSLTRRYLVARVNNDTSQQARLLKELFYRGKASNE